MNRQLWKCCGKTFSDITKYNDHFLIVHTKNADYKGTDATNSSDHTTLSETADSGTKHIRIPKKTTRRNKCKKDVAVVDSIGKSNDSYRIIEKSTIFFLNMELDDNILRESVKSSSESNDKCIRIEIKAVDHLEKSQRTCATNKQCSAHTFYKPYKCKTCDKSYSYISSLREHKRLHTGKILLNCTWCRMQFVKNSLYQVHLRTHAGHKPFKCDI
ncbi:hypothetical protein NPIL_364371 [Nephila pilipes]|uniref:C2H2-type domain-containing protein n=1 Tax=Nephila pilipes TaxID=299642 RepID=A0A8X6I2X3_NEPPI|nr:hypothetical protein NPIL_364371 [Nephila pilipes]